MADSFLKMASSAISASKTGLSRARQFTEERIGTSEKTEYGAQFENSLAQVEKTKSLTDKLVAKFQAVIQANPSVRVEEFLYNQLDKKTPSRPTNAFALGQLMQDGSVAIGAETTYGSTLFNVGTCMKKVGIAEKDFMQQSMDFVVQPLKSSMDDEMKKIANEKKILEGKRLDLDACRARLKKSDTADKRSQAEIELSKAQEEYDRQYEITKLQLENINKIRQKQKTAVESFVNALGDYHTQCQQYVADLQRELGMSTLSSDTTSSTSGNTATAPVLDIEGDFLM